MIDFEGLLILAEDYCDEQGGTFRIYDGYSGRGMYGKVSPAAFVTDLRDEDSRDFFADLGFHRDSLGMDTIYYQVRGAYKPEESED